MYRPDANHGTKSQVNQILGIWWSSKVSRQSSRQAAEYGISDGQQLISKLTGCAATVHKVHVYMYCATFKSHLPVSTDTEHHTCAVPCTHSDATSPVAHILTRPSFSGTPLRRTKPDKLDKRVGLHIRFLQLSLWFETWPGSSAVSARSGRLEPCHLQDINHPQEIPTVA